MKVGYVLDRFPSPYQTFVLEEMLALEARGIELCVFSLGPPGQPVHEAVGRLQAPVVYVPSVRRPCVHLRRQLRLAAGCLPVWLGTLRVALLPPSRLAVASWLRGAWLGPEARALGAEHLHAHFASGANLAALVAARLMGVPFSFTIHAVDLYARPVRLCQTLKAASFAVTISEYNRRHVASLCGQALAWRIHIVRAGIDTAPLAELARAPGPVPLILSVGRLVEKKGHRYLIEAAGLLRDQGIDCRTLIVGDGPLRAELAALVEQLGLGDRLTLEPPVTQERLRELYATADVFALPCVIAADGDRDGIPVSLMEAMAAGLPVVSTPISGIPELVDDAVGCLVTPNDPLDLARALANLLADPAKRLALGEAARERVRQQFDVARSAEQLERLFRGQGRDETGGMGK